MANPSSELTVEDLFVYPDNIKVWAFAAHVFIALAFSFLIYIII